MKNLLAVLACVGMLFVFTGGTKAQSLKPLTRAQVQGLFIGKPWKDQNYKKFHFKGSSTSGTYTHSGRPVGKWRLKGAVIIGKTRNYHFFADTDRNGNVKRLCYRKRANRGKCYLARVKM